jgi:hypothetical protein
MHSTPSITQLSLLLLVFQLATASFGFTVPRSSGRTTRTRSSPVTTKLHAKREPPEKEEPTKTSTSASTTINGNQPDASPSCNLEEQLDKDLEEGFNRRNPPIESIPEAGGPAQMIKNVTNSILDWTFIRVADKNLVQSYLLSQRSYARSGPFATENLTRPAAVEDLLPEPTKIKDSFYLSAPAGILTFVAACGAFPILANFLVNFMDSSPQDLDEIVSKLVPGIAVLYGTFISTTLSILYNRQRFVQDSVAQETSMLSFLLQNMVYLFKKDRRRMILSGQATADQVRILLRETRGLEYITIIYADPYTRILHLIEEEEERLVEEHGDFLSKGVSIVISRY